MLAYLEAENAYKEQALQPVARLREKLYRELVGRLQPQDSTVPVRDRGYLYFTRYQEGAEYPVHLRRKDENGALEEVLLDVGKLAEGHAYYAIGNRAISPGGQLLAYGEDVSGRRNYTLRIKDLRRGRLLPDEIPGTTAALAWAKDEGSFFYVEKDPVTLLGVRVKRHVLGTAAGSDRVVYEEKDASFYLSLRESGDHRFVLLVLQSTRSDEVRVLATDHPEASFQVLAPRSPDMKMSADHLGSRWIIRTNWKARDFRIMEVADGRIGDRKLWKELIPGEDQVLLSGMVLCTSHLVIAERRDGVAGLRLYNWATGTTRQIRPEEEAGTLWLSANLEQDTPWLRFQTSSLRSPRAVLEENLLTGTRRLLRRDPVQGGFDPERYRTERVRISVRDGVRVPVTLVAHRNTPRDGTAPLYLYAYGSYGANVDPLFRPHVLSLLDRGFVFAIAHIRGSSTLGRGWYEEGKLLRKKNTFRDFVDVTEQLVKLDYAAADKVVAAGGSAGGLLMGAVVNMRPDLYRAVVAHVPFVDVVTTMLDESIPLTTNEFHEWGNPMEKPFYDYMLSYSPYDQVERKDYPAMLVTTGLWDSQVQYFEPAKWVARLRDRKTDANLLLLHTNMDAGHGGATGRFRRYRELAMEYAFVLQEVARR
jgi:oligopeptidase B